MKKTLQPGELASTASAVSSSQPKSAAETDPKETLLIAIIPISDSEFEALAANRAKAVRDYILLGGKVDADRLLLTHNQTGGVRQEGARVYLQLD